MSEIKLYEYAPTRSLKCRWILHEAGLEYESRGNVPEIIHSEELCKVQPLGKLPAAIIDGRHLFESSAIVAAIADRVPEKKLIAAPGTFERSLHDQWSFFATSEIESWAWCALLNTHDFLQPKEEHVPEIVPQTQKHFCRGAQAVEDYLADHDFIIGDSFSATDINVGYAIYLGRFAGFLDEKFTNLHAYLGRLSEREHCTFAKQ